MKVINFLFQHSHLQWNMNWRLKVLPFVMLYCSFSVSLIDSQQVFEMNSFEQGNDSWAVQNSSWLRMNISDLKRNYSSMPFPPDHNKSKIVMVPANSTAVGGMSVMYKDIVVPALTNLEVFFTCLILGWKDSNDPLVRINNPVLQVLYDDVLVFHLESAISNSSGHYSNENWNQFRLFSSYKSNFTMRITLMASFGKGQDKLVAVDNVIIKMTSNSSRNGSFSSEPETKIKEKNGTWEKILSESEEDEEFAEKNGTSALRPEFCDLLPEKGPCKGSWIRYHYNSSTNLCEKFTYGGCDGNENNFHVKLACEVICQLPNKTEDETLFDVIFFGSMLSPDKKMKNKTEPKYLTALSLSFDEGFKDWTSDSWRLFPYDSFLANSQHIAPQNKSSKKGASPSYKFNTLFKRPHLMHTIQLIANSNLSITFSLRLVGNVNPILHPFFDTINPGFKIYVGDFLVFDFLVTGKLDNLWHTYRLNKSTTSILKFPQITNSGSPYQIIRIEAWQGSGGRGYVILDDLSITQTPLKNTTAIIKPFPKITSELTRTTIKKTTSTTKSTTTATSLPFPCYLSKSVGPCTMEMSRYYFDKGSSTCKSFTYSGCKGNANNFQSMAACRSKCAEKPGSMSAIKNICQLPFSEGVCRGYFEKFYYDSDSESCISFVYTGCGGNGNKFDSKNECLSTCKPTSGQIKNFEFPEFATAFPRRISDCKLAIATGPCKEQIPMFAYDARTSSCIRFTYGGCGGNGNRFFSNTSCQNTCKPSSAVTALPTTKITTTIPRVTCDNPLVTTCVGNFKNVTYFYFDKSNNMCVRTTGCQSNSGNGHFSSRSSCESLCKVKSDRLEPRQCLLAPLEGPCGGGFRRYFYDAEEGKCLIFRYGGCKGNMNNFEAKRDCEVACKGAEKKVLVSLLKSVCALPKVKGPCSRSFKRFYYDNSTNKCVEFDYSGCGGNDNQFVNEEDCRTLCGQIGKAEKESGDTAFAVAESVLGVFLLVLLGLAIWLGFKYFKVRRDRENYRIFSEQRSGSVSSLAETIPNESPMAYENPGSIAYENPSFSYEPENRVETNSIQMSAFGGGFRRSDDGAIL